MGGDGGTTTSDRPVTQSQRLCPCRRQSRPNNLVAGLSVVQIPEKVVICICVVHTDKTTFFLGNAKADVVPKEAAVQDVLKWRLTGYLGYFTLFLKVSE